MKFYFGNEDIRYIVEGYSRVGKELIIRYMDGSSKVIIDERMEYEVLLKDRMLKQLRNRNNSFDFKGAYGRVFIDSLALFSVYLSLAACLIKGEGDVNGMIYLSSFALGAWALDRDISIASIIKDIKKTNMFLEVNDSNLNYEDIDVNTIDSISYNEMKKIYRKVLQK